MVIEVFLPNDDSTIPRIKIDGELCKLVSFSYDYVTKTDNTFGCNCFKATVFYEDLLTFVYKNIELGEVFIENEEGFWTDGQRNFEYTE